MIIPEELFDTIEAMSIEQDLSISGVIVNLIENALTPMPGAGTTKDENG